MNNIICIHLEKFQIPTDRFDSTTYLFCKASEIDESKMKIYTNGFLYTGP